MKPFDSFRENYTPETQRQPSGFTVIGGVIVLWCALYFGTVILFSL